MTLQQPMPIPSDYYEQTATRPVPVSSSLGLDKDTRKRKQSTSAKESYFYNNQWQADQPPSEQQSSHQNQYGHQHHHYHKYQHQHQQKYWSSTQGQIDLNENSKPSSHTPHYTHFDALPQHQQQTQVPFVFDTYQHHEQHQQHNDPIERILQTQFMDHHYLDESSRPSYTDTQKNLVPWVDNLTIDQSTAIDQPSSHSSMDSSNYTAFCPHSFLDSLPDISQCDKPDLDALLDTPLISNKSVYSLPSSTSACDQSDGTSGLQTSNSQHNPASLSTGGTPPISPAAMTSTHSSPAITPMGGRAHNISFGKPQHPYPHHHTATPISNLYHQHSPPLSSPTGLMALTTKHNININNSNSNSNHDGNMISIINEGTSFDSYPFIEQPSTTPMEFMMDSWSQHASNPSSTSSSSTTNSASTMGTFTATTNHSNEASNNTLRSVPPRNLHVVAASRILQQQETTAKIRPIIQQYLQSKNPAAMGEKTVIIMSSKVAQKSYGTEKRFLCPPPTAILVGSTWWTKKNKQFSTNSIGLTSTEKDSHGSNSNGDDGDDGQQQVSFYDGHGNTIAKVVPPKVTVSISGESSSQAGQMEWYIQANGAVAGQTGLSQQQMQSHQTTQDMSNTRSRFKNLSSMETKNNGGDWYHNSRAEPLGGGRCVSKQLYISDADEKRKRVECLAKLQIDGQWMGTLAGKGIKVISKPSKKRQSVKNMELCIHHGSIVSLFNRIRSQTVSTKYLGVSNGKDSAFAYPGQIRTGQTKNNDGACFVARTASWDPFVIWLVDTSRSSEQQQQQKNRINCGANYPEDYIGHRNFKPSVNYPPPPAIALRNTSQQPLPIHYNQHIVLQCLTTGMVSPVMVIRRVDKASTVVGGARCMDEAIHINGGEYGDEYLGDPVCQLHKIALQIVQEPSKNVKQQQQQQQNGGSDLTTGLMEGFLPRHSAPIAYLACLNDIVGMHKSTETRQPILKSPPPPPPPSYQLASCSRTEFIHDDGRAVQKRKRSTNSSSSLANSNHGTQMMIMNNSGKIDSKTTSTYSRQNDSNFNIYGPPQLQHQQGSTPTSTMTNALDASGNWVNHRSRSVSVPETHHGQISSSTNASTTLPISPSSASWINGPLGGAYWHEDVSDAAVWTLVGTDIARYTFLPPPPPDSLAESTSSEEKNVDNTKHPFQQQQQHHRGSTSLSPSSLTFPHLSHYSIIQQDGLLHLHGSHLARDLQVWLGDIQAPHVEYKSRELLICRLPPRNELLECSFIESYQTSSTTTSTTNLSLTSLPTTLPTTAHATSNTTLYQLPLLLVKTADDIIHNTNIHYQF